MLKWIETTGRSEEDAISAALFQLGLDRDDVSVEVIERAKSGFLGFGGNPAKVRVSYEVPDEGEAPKVRPAEKAETVAAVREESRTVGEQKKSKPSPQEKKISAEAREQNSLQPGDEVLIGQEEPSVPREVGRSEMAPASPEDQKAARIREFLAGLMVHLQVEAVPEVYVGENGYQVILQGKGLGAIIGRRGETLDAIQQLTNYAVNHGQSKRVRIHIDAEGYRAKREESLQRLATKVAGKVVKYRKNMTLEPMNAYERHVIHATLQDYPNVTTYSTGVEPNRRTVVAYAPGQK